MNLKEKQNLVEQLHEEGKTQREIAQQAHMSLRDISKIVRKLDGIPEEKSIETQALDLFYKGKKPVEVVVELNIDAQETIKLYKEYLELEDFHRLVLLYDEIKDNLRLFLKLYYTISENHINHSDIINLLKNSNELVNLKKVLQMKRKELYDIELIIKQYQSQYMKNYWGY